MIYLDNNATTFLDPVVREKLIELLSWQVGNPSSVHQMGQKGRGMLVAAYKEAARFFSVPSSELLFTASATEALNTLLQVPIKGHIITSLLEHPALLEPVRRLEKQGRAVTYLGPSKGGAIAPELIQEAIRPDTRLIALMAANNETGIKTDIEAIGALAERAGIDFLVDGVALLGKEQLEIPSGVTAMVFSSHKIHGPVGAGCALIRRGYPFAPLLVGGEQNQGRRAGTENLFAIYGFVEALKRLEELGCQSYERMAAMRDRFEKGLTMHLKDIIIHGREEARISNTSSIAFLGLDAESLLIHLDLAGVIASHGSACSSGSLGPSKTLLKMGLAPLEVRSTVRFSLSRMTTDLEIDRALNAIVDQVCRLRCRN